MKTTKTTRAFPPVPNSRLRATGYGLRIPGSDFPATGYGLPTTTSGFQFPGSQFRTPNSELRIAFTLVEILVVVGIIALLAGILLPAFDLMKRNVKANLTQSNINLIATACEQFYNDHEEYPVSTSASGSDEFFTTDSHKVGKKLIVLQLTGYANNPDPPGTKGTPGATMYDDDGRDGFGFRTVASGKIYGPYNGTEKIPTIRNGSDPPVFNDGLGETGNAILYYRADAAGAPFTPSDNKDGNDENMTGAQLQKYQDAKMPFLIISAGIDGVYGEADGDNDDITNK